MPTNKDYEVIKKITENRELVDRMERENPGVTAKMAGYLLSPWLPIGVGRKIVMVVIFLIALLGSLLNPFCLLLLIILPLFSPRVIGEIVSFLGRPRH
jgi:hypothetical protein